MPIRRAGLMTRQAISPRLAIRIRLNMPGDLQPGRVNFSTAFAVRPTTLSCWLVQKNQTAAKTFQQERTSRSSECHLSLHVTRRRGPLLTAYDSQAASATVARSGAPQKSAGTSRFVGSKFRVLHAEVENVAGAPAARAAPIRLAIRRQLTVGAALAAHLRCDPLQHLDVDVGGAVRRPAFDSGVRSQRDARDGTGGQMRTPHDAGWLWRTGRRTAVVGSLGGGLIDLEQRLRLFAADGGCLGAPVRMRAHQDGISAHRAAGEMNAARGGRAFPGDDAVADDGERRRTSVPTGDGEDSIGGDQGGQDARSDEHCGQWFSLLSGFHQMSNFSARVNSLNTRTIRGGRFNRQAVSDSCRDPCRAIPRSWRQRFRRGPGGNIRGQFAITISVKRFNSLYLPIVDRNDDSATARQADLKDIHLLFITGFRFGWPETYSPATNRLYCDTRT